MYIQYSVTSFGSPVITAIDYKNDTLTIEAYGSLFVAKNVPPQTAMGLIMTSNKQTYVFDYLAKNFNLKLLSEEVC